jgi:hypothetical protein
MRPVEIARKNNLRRHTRYEVPGDIWILWEDSEGRERVSKAKLVDVSTSGILLRAVEKVPLRSYVSCNDWPLGISGRGSVRHCNYIKGKYEIGVEFASGTGWGEPVKDPKS